MMDKQRAQFMLLEAQSSASQTVPTNMTGPVKNLSYEYLRSGNQLFNSDRSSASAKLDYRAKRKADRYCK